MTTLPTPTYDAKEYSNGRPDYPEGLFELIASKTPTRDLAWDVGTGTGQAVPFLAQRFKNVIATDISQTQLDSAPKLPNVKYRSTPAVMSVSEFEQLVTSKSSLDLITIAQALHWFDLPRFYELVRWGLTKPNGIIAAWCYTTPLVSIEVDSVFGPLYRSFDGPGWKETTAVVDDKYRSIWFPFDPVDGLDSTGPFEFIAEKVLRMEDYLAYIRSWSAYNAAKANGVEMLSEDIVKKFEKAWYCDGVVEKVVKFPIFLRLGRINPSQPK